MKDAFVLCGTARPLTARPWPPRGVTQKAWAQMCRRLMTSFFFVVFFFFKAACVAACTRLPVCVDRFGWRPPSCLASCVCESRESPFFPAAAAAARWRKAKRCCVYEESMKFSVTDALPPLEARTGPGEGHLLFLRARRSSRSRRRCTHSFLMLP